MTPLSTAERRPYSTPDHDDERLSLAEAAAYLHISSDAVETLLRTDGTFPRPTGQGRNRRWRLGDLRAYWDATTRRVLAAWRARLQPIQ